MSVLAQGIGDRAGQSGVGCGCDLHTDGQGFVYPVAIIDWYTRKVLAWQFPNTLDGQCVRGAAMTKPEMRGDEHESL